MSSYWRGVLAIYSKDLRLEARTRETVTTVLVFSLLVAFIFNFAFDPSASYHRRGGPGHHLGGLHLRGHPGPQ